MTRSADRQHGFSLIELLIVVIIAALAFTGVALSLGATSRAKLRSSCWTLVAGIRYAYSRAVTAGMTTRITMDFGGRSFKIEETKGRVVLNREDESGEGLNPKGDDDDGGSGAGSYRPDAGVDGFGGPGLFGGGMSGGFMSLMGLGMGMGSEEEGSDMTDIMASFAEGGITDPFLASMQENRQGGPAGYRRPSFSPLGGKRGEARQLEGNTQFVTVYTPHEPEPRTGGRAYIYFFPKGLTEHAIIQLSDGDEQIYSVEVHPLTGNAVIHREAIEPEEELDELQEAEE